MHTIIKKLLTYSFFLLFLSCITQTRSLIHFQPSTSNLSYSQLSYLSISRINSPIVHSNNIVWEEAPSLVVNDSGYAHTYDGKIYFVGGSAIQEFDPTRGTWAVVNDQGIGYNPYRGGSALIGDRIYMVHGWTAEKTSYYDIGDNLLGSFTPANYNRLDVAVAALDGILYVSGGWASGDLTATRRFAAYNTQNDTWYSLEPMITARIDHEMIAVGRYLYAIGGVLGECPVERYDPDTDQWEDLGNGPALQEFGVALTNDNKIIVGSSVYTQIYLINENKWFQGPQSNLSDNELRTVAAVGANSLAVLDEYVYSIGGRDAPGNYYAYVWKTEIIIPPMIDHPRDVVYEEDTTGHYVTWNAVDDNPAFYNVSRNGELILTETWNGEAIIINVDDLPTGTHEFCCTVTDQDGHYIHDSVLVTVIDNSPPTIDHPEDITFEEGNPGFIITWHPSDNNPENYVITRNVMVVASGSWNGSTITISLADLSSGNYTFICEVFDTSGNSASDIVVVTVTGTGKVSSSPWSIGAIFVIWFVIVVKRKTKINKE